MEIELGKSWGKKLQGRIERYNFEVGVFDDKPHMDPVVTGRFETPALKNYAGGPVRRTSRQAGDKSVAQILVENMQRLNINILQRPFQERNSDILKFTAEFLKFVTSGKSSVKRLENLLQAIVRNPILKQEYGKNKAETADAKGFNRHLFDTGQMFRAIRARVSRV
jgi:hypothetical protein